MCFRMTGNPDCSIMRDLTGQLCALWTAHMHPSFGNQNKAGADACQGLALIQDRNAHTGMLREALVCNSFVGSTKTGGKMVADQYRAHLEMNLFCTA